MTGILQSLHGYFRACHRWAVGDCDGKWRISDDFLDRFASAERSRMVLTRVMQSGNPWFNQVVDRSDTMDYVFLLSLEEVVKYFGDSGRLWNRTRPDNIRIPDFNPDLVFGFNDEFNENRAASVKDGVMYRDHIQWWWLRTPGFADDGIVLANVGLDGYVNVYGHDTISVTMDIGGFRPAMWLYR